MRADEQHQHLQGEDQDQGEDQGEDQDWCSARGDLQEHGGHRDFCGAAWHGLSAHYRKDREVLLQDAVQWLSETEEPFAGSVFTGLPDMLDIQALGTGVQSAGASVSTASKARRKVVGCEQLAEEYLAWMHKCAIRIFSRLAKGECAIFSQTDTRVIDEATGRVVQWLDKSHMLCAAADLVPGVQLLWHKIALDSQAAISSHRPCYTHVLCFGKHFTYKVSAFMTPDIIDRGEMTWLKATGKHT